MARSRRSPLVSRYGQEPRPPLGDGGQGSQGKNTKDVWYSSDGRHWHEVPGTPWKERHAASVFAYENALWMIAGNHMGRDIWKLVKKKLHV